MTPAQRVELIAAADKGDYDRAVTIALHIAAKLARDGNHKQAIAIRGNVDGMLSRQHLIVERRRLRLEIAARLWACQRDIDDADAIKYAEDLIEMNEETPTKLELES